MQVQNMNSASSLTFGTKLHVRNINVSSYSEQFLNKVIKSFENQTKNKNSQMSLILYKEKPTYNIWTLDYSDEKHADRLQVYMENANVFSKKDFIIKLKSFLKLFETRQKQADEFKTLQEECTKLKKAFAKNTDEKIKDITDFNIRVPQLKIDQVVKRIR